jgi:basic amino acid/polyamine antiporter, APA family
VAQHIALTGLSLSAGCYDESLMAKPAQVGLVRSIGRLDLIAATINAVIGAGIFGLPARIFGLIGDYSVLAFLACAVFASFIVICFAEVGSRFNATGGPYLYAREAFGPVVGFEAGWLMWVARVSAFAANANLLVGYAAFFWPFIASRAGRNVFLCVVATSLMAINILGIRNATRVNNIFTAGKLIPIALFVAAGLWFTDWGRFTFNATPGYPQFSSSVLLLVYAFTGFEMAVIPSGEIRDPQRNIPIALLTAIAIIAMLYLSIQIVCIGTLPGLADSQRPLADAANRFLGGAGAAIISAGIVISIAGNLHITLLSASRIPFAMGVRGELPQLLSDTHPRFHTPHYAIVFTGAVMLALTLSGTFIYAVTVSTLARLIIYITTCVALPVLRRKADAPVALLRIPGGVAIAVAAILLAAWLLSNSTAREARDTAIAAALGFAIYAVAKLRARTDA